MEITFHNRREDFQAFYDFVVRETEDGKAISSQAYRSRQVWTVTCTALIGALTWGATGRWQAGVSLALVIFLTSEALIFLIAGFKPRYYEGVQAYKRQEKRLTTKDLQMLQLPKTLTIDENWLEIRSSETLHGWRWRQIDRVSLTSDFIFVLVSNWPIVYIPRRDFLSDQSFIDFGQKLTELMEKNKGQPIGE